MLLAYSLVTGALLLVSVLWQWRLYFVRRSGDGRQFQKSYRSHRWTGLVPLVFLLIHMGGPRASLLWAVSALLFASSVSGLFNHEVLRQKKQAMRKAWLATHIGSAALILPLVCFHIWAALAFKGP